MTHGYFIYQQHLQIADLGLTVEGSGAGPSSAPMGFEQAKSSGLASISDPPRTAARSEKNQEARL